MIIQTTTLINILLISSIHSFYPNTLIAQQQNHAFHHKVENALSYLESVCGEDGIKKAIILKRGKTIIIRDMKLTLNRI